ncbi:MAG: tetratricopeptide repeat protein [Bacteroidia bacterium]|nr:tetratricopeptide repeat protein [Bacteroidia bacterium]
MTDTNNRIEKYLEGGMDAGELKLFEAELLINPALAEELQLHRDVAGFLSRYGKEQDFRKTLDEAHYEYMKEFDKQEERQKQMQRQYAGHKRRIPVYAYWIAAAVVLIILVCTLVLKFTEKKKSNEILFAEYYQTHEPFCVRSSDSLQKNPSADCMKEYSKKNYGEALSCFKKLLNSDNNNRICIFFSGISYIETKNYKDAIACFNILTEKKDINFSNASLWYSGLCYLKENKTDSALVCFRKLVSTDGFYKEKAHDIIRELE